MKTTRVVLLGCVTACLLCPFAMPGATVRFSGYDWQVRGTGRGGPGPNHWEPANVFVDTNGWLHLKLTERDGRWYCSEVFTKERLGFGRYEFQLSGRIDLLDRNVVLGLFNYPTSDVGPDATHEIDVEFARWGNASAPVGNYTIWPTTTDRKQQSHSFAFVLNTEESTHVFNWTPTNVAFKSFTSQNKTSRVLAHWRYEPKEPELWISQKPMPVHLNLWCFQGRPPENGKELELIIRSFKFTPLK